jgi:hypothetical protein
MASTRPKLGLVKIETVPGTDAAPVVGTDSIRLIDEVTVTPLDVTYKPLNYARDYIGTDIELAAWFYTKLSFKIPFSGSGAAGTAPNADPLLRICGLKKTTTAATKVEYTDDVDTGFETATIYHYFLGKLHKALMCMGDLKVQLDGGEFPFLQIDVIGLHGGITDVTPGAPTFANFVDPVVVNKLNTPTPTLHGYSGIMHNFSAALGNKLVYTNAPGVEDVQLPDRERTGAITIRDTLVTTKDWFTPVKNSTLAATAITHGTTAGNIVKVDAANTQLKSPKYGDKDMIGTMSFDLRFVRTSSTTPALKLTYQ